MGGRSLRPTVRFPPICPVHGRGLLRPLNVHPRHSIARDQRPLRVRPKSTRANISQLVAIAHRGVDWLPHMRAGLDSHQQRLRLQRSPRHFGVAGFFLECLAGFVGIRTLVSRLRVIRSDG